jgi:hypothetical protein
LPHRIGVPIGFYRVALPVADGFCFIFRELEVLSSCDTRFNFAQVVIPGNQHGL